MGDDRKKRSRKAEIAGDVAAGAAAEGGCCLLTAVVSAVELLGIAGLPLLLLD